MSNKAFYEQKNYDISHWTDSNGTRSLDSATHLHRDLELVLLLEGETEVLADSVHAKMKGGDVFLTFPNQIHAYKTIQRERYMIFTVKADLLPELAEVFELSIPRSPVIEGAGRDPHVLALFEALAEACRLENHPYADARRRGYLLALFAELLGRMDITGIAVGDSGALRSIVAFCTRNFSENLSLSLLEEKLHLNKYYISHLFSGKLGLRFNDYVNSLRISEACRYLVATDRSVTEISELVGFNTLRTFNRSFIKQMGMSPSEYRKQDAPSLKRP